MRLAALQNPKRLGQVTADVHENWTCVTKARLSTRKVAFRAFAAGKAVNVGSADVDLNGMILTIELDENAPWWAAQPFIDAMAGK